MSYTVENFAESIAFDLGEAFTDIETRKLFLSWVKQGYLVVNSLDRGYWKNSEEVFATFEDQRQYELSDTTAEIRYMWNDSSGVEVAYATEESIIRTLRKSPRFEKGSPTHWYYYGISGFNTAPVIGLYPIPNGAYLITVGVLEKPKELADNALIPLPPEYIEAIRHYVRSLYQYHDDKIQLAAQSMEIFNNLLGSFMARYGAPAKPKSSLPVHRLSGVVQSPVTQMD